MRPAKFFPGQRVRINEAARDLYPEWVGAFAHVGIGGIAAPYLFSGNYYVHTSNEKGGTVILRLPEHCLDDAPSDFHL